MGRSRQIEQWPLPMMASSTSVQQQAVPRSAGNPGEPGWPGRRHHLLLGLVFAAIAVYGSLVPFGYQPLGLREAVERFSQLPYRSLATGGRADLAANVLLFVPMGYCWLAVFVLDRRFSIRTVAVLPLVLLLSVAFSIALEFSQLWFPLRTASRNDVVAQAVGTVLGMGLWLAVGQTIADWLRSLAPSARPRRLVDLLLLAYFVGLVIYSLQPFDLTTSATALFRKYREGRICLVPFSETTTGFLSLWGSAVNVAIFIPVGMLATTWLTPAKRPVRSLGASLILGALAVVVIELGQVIVRSCPASTTDLITGIAGVAVGAWLMRRWQAYAGEREPQAAPGGSTRRAALWLALACVYLLLVAAALCVPSGIVDDIEQVKARYDGFFRVPFAGLLRGSHLNALLDAPKKVLFFAPLGALLALAVLPLPVPRGIRRILLCASLVAVAGMGVSIEMAQLFLLPHQPSIADVLLYTAGAGIGMLVTLRTAARQETGSITRT